MPFFAAIHDPAYVASLGVYCEQVGIEDVYDISVWVRGGTAFTANEFPHLLDAKVFESRDFTNSVVSADVARILAIQREGHHRVYLYQEDPITGNRYVNYVETYFKFHANHDETGVFWLCLEDVVKRFDLYMSVSSDLILIAKYPCRDFADFVGGTAFVDA